MNRARNFKTKAEEVGTKVGSPCPTCGKAYCEEDLSTVKENFIEQARQEIGQAKTLAEAMAKHKTNLEKALSIESALVKTTPDVTAIIARIEELTKQLSSLRHREKEVVAIESLVTRARTEVDRISKEINPFIALIARHEDNTVSSKSTFKSLKDELKAIQEQTLLLEKARQVYSPAGVRSHILTSVTPFLNTRTAEYLNTLSDGNITAEWSTMDVTKKVSIATNSTLVCRRKVQVSRSRPSLVVRSGRFALRVLWHCRIWLVTGRVKTSICLSATKLTMHSIQPVLNASWVF